MAAGRRGPPARSDRPTMETAFTAKAMENLEAAELLCDHGMYNACANRTYYAALHAAVAALAHAGLEIGRIRHEAIQSQFNRELIHRRKVYPSRMKSDLLILQAARDDADYRTKAVSKKLAVRQLGRAKQYIEAIRKETGGAE